MKSGRSCRRGRDSRVMYRRGCDCGCCLSVERRVRGGSAGHCSRGISTVEEVSKIITIYVTEGSSLV